MKSGIYQIRNKKNGKVYIGSTANFKKRWRVHRSSLRGGYHFNEHLQRAWNKYGEFSFAFEILEQCSIKHLREKEQIYLEKVPDSYNVSQASDAPMRGRKMPEKSKRLISRALTGHKRSKRECRIIGQRSSKDYPAFIHRNGEEITEGRNLSELCRKHHPELDPRAMRSVAAGRLLSHREWMLKSKAKLNKNSEWSIDHLRSSRASHYPAFVNLESGEIIEEGINLKKLCHDRELSRPHMVSVAKGRRPTCQGWALLENAWIDKDGNWQVEHGSAGEYPTLINDDGRIEQAGKNISRLCRRLGLNTSHLHQVISGERNHHKGWRIYIE